LVRMPDGSLQRAPSPDQLAALQQPQQGTPGGSFGGATIPANFGGMNPMWTGVIGSRRTAPLSILVRPMARNSSVATGCGRMARRPCSGRVPPILVSRMGQGARRQ
jgi:hypothetical protein